jgi:transposase-like protein
VAVGELAARLQPKYGEQTLARFAEEIGIKASTLERWRSTYTKRKGKPAPGPVSHSVLKALQSHPEADKVIEEHLKEHPKLTRRQADGYMSDYRATHPEWRVTETNRWFAKAEKHAQGAIQLGHPAQQHLDPAILRQALDNPEQTEAALRKGGEALITLADEVKRALAPPTPPPMFDDAPGDASSD